MKLYFLMIKAKNGNNKELLGIYGKEPVMIFATASVNRYIPAGNLSTTCKHHTTCTNLCSTIRNTLETCCNLSTATDLQQIDLTGPGPIN